ncbi:MAG: hypothetical protein JO228_06630 [Xanthobacteraceae bacterium]|nr:hypothetical protein [Xanthobacteraceae bacterium]
MPLVVAALLLGELPASAQDGVTTSLCPVVDFTGFSLAAGSTRVEEKLRWDAARRSYLFHGPELAQRFLYPDPKRTLAELKSDPAHDYELPVDRTITLLDQDVCRPKIEISGRCELAAVAGGPSQRAFVFTAEYQDDCEQRPVEVAVRLEPLDVGGRTGLQFSFFNAFRQIYDSGMDVYEGENVVNPGYRLK